MSLATKVLVALVAGVVCGLFFGESVAFLGVVGSAFILLLQMTVLPYIMVSLTGGLGGLSASGVADLAKRSGGFLLALWALALGAVVLIPLAYPDWPSASFFSSSLVQSDQGFDFLSLFIPSNPFNAMSAPIVPAMVVFSIAVGVALIGVERKQALLEILASISAALSRITTFVVQLAPYGVFAIVAKAAGTMDPADIKGLEVYVVIYVVVALVMCFWTLPALVALLTPIRHREVVWSARDALVTAFATGSVFVVLAVIAERTKGLLQSHREDAGDSEEFVDVVVPTSYAFPSAGLLLSLSFILFAGWFSGFDIAISQYPVFLITGLASFFGSTMVAIPFMLNLFQIPSDTFQLFIIADNVVGSRFGSMLAAMHILTLALLSACAMERRIRIRPMRIAGYLALTCAITLGAIGAVRLGFEAIGGEYLGYQKFIDMRPNIEPVETKIVETPPAELPPTDSDVPTLERIRRRGALRAGYRKDAMPFAFRNSANELVGFDIDMVNLLARELGVSLELVQIEQDDMPRLLSAGYLDTVVGGTTLTTQRLEKVSFSEPYMDQTLAFIVRDHRRHEFSSRDSVKALESPRIAVPDVAYYVDKISAYLPQAEIVKIDSARDFFRAKDESIDALVYTAEAGSAWCLVYPSFSVAVPRPDLIAAPVAYPVAYGDQMMVEFLSAWINLKKKDGTIDDLFDHWIKGEATRKREPRWSVIRNVLGWVD